MLTCMVLYNMLRSHQWGAEKPPTPADDIQPPENDQVEQGQDVRNLSGKAKRQRNLLTDYFNNLGALAGQEDRI